MRIVYDDTQLSTLAGTVRVLVTQNFASTADMKNVTRHSCNMDRVEVGLVKTQLNKMLKGHNFEIGNDVVHAHGIGNNNRYPVFFSALDEKQLVGYLHLNSDMYGGVYVYVSNFNGCRCSDCYKLTSSGYLLEK